jgi:tetratricopeptide (TPR) repeat protein
MRHLIRPFSLVCLATLAAVTAQTRPGTWVTLEVSSGNYAFVSPWNRKVLIPPFENESENFVTVYLTVKGEREALENRKVAVALAAKFNATLTPKLKGERTTEEERKTALAEVARGFGVTPKEADRAIRKWGRKAVDPYDKGEIALYQQNYPKATEQLSKSYEMRKSALEKAQDEMVEVAFSLGQSLYGQGRYREAEEKLREANALRDDDATILNHLGMALYQIGLYVEAEQLFKRALAIRALKLKERSCRNERSLYAMLGLTAVSLGIGTETAEQAEQRFKRELETAEKRFGAEHLCTAASLNNLAELYRSQKQFAEAEPLFIRALAIREKVISLEHPDTAMSLNNLGGLYYSQGKYMEAESLFIRALAVNEKSLGSEHWFTAVNLNNLARLYLAQGKYVEAEPLYKRALNILEKMPGTDHPDTATILNNLGAFYVSQSKYADAEPFFRRSLTIVEQLLGANHLYVAVVIENYADLLRKMNREAEAAILEAHVKEIRAKAFKK